MCSLCCLPRPEPGVRHSDCTEPCGLLSSDWLSMAKAISLLVDGSTMLRRCCLPRPEPGVRHSDCAEPCGLLSSDWLSMAKAISLLVDGSTMLRRCCRGVLCNAGIECQPLSQRFDILCHLYTSTCSDQSQSHHDLSGTCTGVLKYNVLLWCRICHEYFA